MNDFKIRLTGSIKRFYTYRSASIKGITFVLEDTQGDRLSKKVRNYLIAQGQRPDNHICWETESGVCYEYTDHKLFVGSSIVEGKW